MDKIDVRRLWEIINRAGRMGHLLFLNAGTKNMKKILILLITPLGLFAQDPFSKITITSDSAVVRRLKKESDSFSLKYKDNVHVKFADETTIDSGSLKVLLKKKSKESIEKIIFKKSVFLKRDNQDVHADCVEIVPEKKLCLLTGNVKVTQKELKKLDGKENKKNIPFIACANKAKFFWDSEEIQLEGDSKNPVSTIIKLEGKLK